MYERSDVLVKEKVFKDERMTQQHTTNIAGELDFLSHLPEISETTEGYSVHCMEPNDEASVKIALESHIHLLLSRIDVISRIQAFENLKKHTAVPIQASVTEQPQTAEINFATMNTKNEGKVIIQEKALGRLKKRVYFSEVAKRKSSAKHKSAISMIMPQGEALSNVELCVPYQRTQMEMFTADIKDIKYSTDKFITKCHNLQGQGVIFINPVDKLSKGETVGERIKATHERTFMQFLVVSNSLTLGKSYSLDELHQIVHLSPADEATIPRFVMSRAIEQAKKTVVIEGQHFTMTVLHMVKNPKLKLLPTSIDALDLAASHGILQGIIPSQEASSTLVPVHMSSITPCTSKYFRGSEIAKLRPHISGQVLTQEATNEIITSNPPNKTFQTLLELRRESSIECLISEPEEKSIIQTDHCAKKEKGRTSIEKPLNRSMYRSKSLGKNERPENVGRFKKRVAFSETAQLSMEEATYALEDIIVMTEASTGKISAKELFTPSRIVSATEVQKKLTTRDQSLVKKLPSLQGFTIDCSQTNKMEDSLENPCPINLAFTGSDSYKQALNEGHVLATSPSTQMTVPKQYGAYASEQTSATVKKETEMQPKSTYCCESKSMGLKGDIQQTPPLETLKLSKEVTNPIVVSSPMNTVFLKSLEQGLDLSSGTEVS